MALGEKYDREIIGIDEEGNQSALSISEDGNIPIIDFRHYEVHKDHLLVASHYDSEVDSTAPLVIYVRPTTAGEIHSVFDAASDQACKFEIYETEDTAVTADGTAMLTARFNREGDYPDTSSASLVTYYAPTESSAGVQKFITHNLGTTAKNPASVTIGGSAESGEEWITHTNNGKALIFVATPDGSAAKVTFTHDYYIH